MEGREPPPRASHPFPDNPDLTKFWGTPYSKAFIKAFSCFAVGYVSICGILYYVKRNSKGPFGFDLTFDKDEYERRKVIHNNRVYVQQKYDLPIEVNSPRGVTADPTMLFDDGVKFVPAKLIVVDDS